MYFNGTKLFAGVGTFFTSAYLSCNHIIVVYDFPNIFNLKPFLYHNIYYICAQ